MYQILLVSTDGEDYKLDCKDSKSIDEAWENCGNLGSKWYFYPICFVIKDNGGLSKRQRIVDCCDILLHLKGTTVKTAMQYIKDNPDEVKAMLS